MAERPTAEEFDLVCDLIEILLAFGDLRPRPLPGSPAERRILEFKAMRDRHRAAHFAEVR